MRENDGERLDRLPATAADREVEGRATREAVRTYFRDRFGVPEGTLAEHTLWEKGAGRVWAFADDVPAPRRVESLGLPVLRTRQEHWKPTTVGVCRFCTAATRNVLVLDRPAAARFAAGEDQAVDWDGDWGYLVVGHVLAGGWTPIGVGLFTRGRLQSMVPKGRRRELPATRGEG